MIDRPDRTLNEDDTDMIRDYRADYNNRPSTSISFIPSVVTTSGRLHCDNFILQTHEKLTVFSPSSEVEFE